MLPPVVRGGAVALSGGVDSAVLLSRLKRHGIAPLYAFHVDHGVRDGPSRRQECLVVDELCSRIGVQLCRVVLKPTRSDEAALRTLRYGALSTMAKEMTVDWVALGHHRDDLVETVLMNVFRGCDLKGLGGMPERFVRDGVVFVRPLLFESSRAELLSEAQAEGLSWFDDPTNEEDVYRRNGLRHRLMPILDDLYPQARIRISGLAKSVVRWNLWFESQLDSALSGLDWVLCSEGKTIDRQLLRDLAIPLLDAWCHRQLCHFAGGASQICRDQVRLLSDWIRSETLGPYPRPFPGDLRFRARKREILLLN